ncbi:MAG: hypothetical protein ACYCW6_24495 [Candidatus Xenobia bacterium]
MQSTALAVRLVAPVVCRCAGLPFSRLATFGEQPSRTALWSLLDDPDFLDCLVTMNPGALPSLRSRRKKLLAEKRPSDARRAEMTLYRYLTRFCSRNDTTGMAGSTMWGQVGERTDLVVSPGKTRHVYPSPRHLEMLAHRLAHGPLKGQARPVLRPWYRKLAEGVLDPHSGCLLEDEGTVWLLGDNRLETLRELARGTEVEAPLARLLELRERLAQSSGAEFAELMQEADALAHGLAPCHALSFPKALRALVLAELEHLEIVLSPVWKPDEEALTHVLSGDQRKLQEGELEVVMRCLLPRRAAVLREKWDVVIRLLDEGVLTLPGSIDHRSGPPWRVHFYDLARTLGNRLLLNASPGYGPITLDPVEAETRLFEQLGKSDVTMPALDRSFFICDSTRPVQRFQLGGRLLERLQMQLAPWFRLAAWHNYREEREQAPRLRRLLPPGESMPLSRFLESLQIQEQQAQLWSEAVDVQMPAPWKVVGDPRSMTVSLEEDRVPPDFEKWLEDKRLVSNIDVMLGGTTEALEAGGGTLIIAEAHSGSEGLGETIFFPQAHPEWNLEGHGREVFGDDVLFLQPPIPSKQVDGILQQLQDVVLAIRNPEGRWPQKQAVPIAELMVTHRPEGICVHDGTRRYRLIANEINVGNIRMVGYSPLRMARWVCGMIPGYTRRGPMEILPEVRLGDLVLSRSMLALPAVIAKRFLDEGTLQQTLCLPRFVFIKTEGKPMLYDLECPFSLEVLSAALADGGEALFSFMQPGPEELWLNLPEGAFTSELRVAATCDGPRYAVDPYLSVSGML